MNSRRFLLRCIAAMLIGAMAPLAWGATNRAPQFRSMRESMAEKFPANVLLIIADGLGHGDLGCYGQTEIRTPNMDRLAAEGVRYTDFYAGSPLANASRCSLITGRHTGHSSVRGGEGIPLPSGELTLARLLLPANYQTTWLGSWGLGLAGSTGTPLSQGFEEVRALLDVRKAQDNYPVTLYRNGEDWTLESNRNGKKGQYFPDLLLLMGTNFLRSAQYRPFLLVYSSTLPGSSLLPPPPMSSAAQTASESSYAGKDWTPAEKRKADSISRLDQDIGRLMVSLEANKLSRNTIVVLTSDSGPEQAGRTNAARLKSTGAFRGGRGDLFEGGIRVPMIVWSPSKIPGGRVSDQVWAAWDLVPTVAELTSLPKPKGIDGISMARSLYGLAQTNQHDFLYWETHQPHTQQAVRMGSWKGIRTAIDKALEIYDLKADPAEQHNLAEAKPEVAARMEQFLKTARTEHPDWPLKQPTAEPNAASPAAKPREN
ncbi:MAG: sulfatase-like hydrolase/transferase [Verrucomicrobiales bacterium]|nr:sulfatase-like hydrolase/transferase [Verrucomicrobiales bacterium]